jgi:hypothetical protein
MTITMSNSKDDPSTVIVPFGKYKGVAAADLPTIDPRYAEWLLAQGWVAQQFAAIHAAIAARGATSDDSPEHNALQVRFLEPAFRLACVQLGLGKRLDDGREDERRTFIQCAERTVSDIKRDLEHLNRHFRGTHGERIARLQSQIEAAEAALVSVQTDDYQCKTQAVFEYHGLDVILYWLHTPHGTKPRSRITNAPSRNQIALELKPTLGDDFPTVMRQMRRLEYAYLVVGTYNGTTVSEQQLRQMFEANSQKVIFVREIEAQMNRKNLSLQF